MEIYVTLFDALENWIAGKSNHERKKGRGKIRMRHPVALHQMEYKISTFCALSITRLCVYAIIYLSIFDTNLLWYAYYNEGDYGHRGLEHEINIIF